MSEPPDLTTDRLIGLPELAAILGLSPRSLQKRRGKGTLPDTEIRVNDRPTLIWRLSFVLGRLWGHGEYDGPIPDAMPLPDVVGVNWVVDRTGMKNARTVQAWAAEPNRRARLGLPPEEDPFPIPTHRIGDVPLYDRADMEAWLNRRGKIRQETSAA